MGSEFTRRGALHLFGVSALAAAGAAVGGAGVRAQQAPAAVASQAAKRTRAVLLGTDGGPRPKKGRAAPASVVVVDGVPYVVDCGSGVARQLVFAGVPLRDLRYVFLTHQHSDHNADYGTLLLLAWASGLHTRVDTFGPPPLAAMTRLAMELNDYDIQIRIVDEGRVPLPPLIHPHEITAGGVVHQDERVKVTAALVHHPPVTPAFAYRFDTPDRSIVFSGDTTPVDSLVALAQGADTLVHEVLYVPAVDRIVANVPNATRLKEHIIASHTSVADVGRVAARCGVKTLVLNHLVPSEDPAVTEELWQREAQANFSGRVVVGRDLMEL